MTRNLKPNYLSHLYGMMSARITSKQLMLCCFQPFFWVLQLQGGQGDFLFSVQWTSENVVSEINALYTRL